MNQVVYPNFVSRLEGDIFESGESEWVQASVDRADELGFSRVADDVELHMVFTGKVD
jgi:hypothetical protein